MVEEIARAKLNLDLLVLGRRPDGYHELDSLVVFTEFGDRLTLGHAPTLDLEVDGLFAAALDAPEDNLVLRAAAAMAASLGCRAEAGITLDKRLPVAAGLGGGSADAAATLRGLARLWRTAVDQDRMHAIALSLGSDVPVCLDAQPRRMRGRGERLDPAPGLPALPILLVNPGRPVSTGAVFARLGSDGFGHARTTDWPRNADVRELAAWLARSRNDLETAATAIEPIVGEALAAVRAQPGCLVARMAGSGATGFGVFPTRLLARRAAEALAAARRDWWVADTVTLG